MSLSRTIGIACGFVAVLIALTVADVSFTQGTLWLPGRGVDGGVVKQGGPDVLAVIAAQGFTAAPTAEPQLLTSALPLGTTLTARALLQNNDRAGTIAWTDSANVKDIFTTLRKNLRSAFSPRLSDLIDETQTEPGKPPRDVLSFLDPAIATDRLVFVRVRQRAYEFHVTAGKEKDVDALVNALTE